MERYGVDQLSDKRDMESVLTIAKELTGTGMMETGMKIGGIGKKPEDVLPVYYLRVLMEQNWIIIRQLDRLNRSLEKAQSE